MAKKVTIMVGFVPIHTKMEVAVDEESSGAHAVCTGTTDSPHNAARVKMAVGCTVCDRSHSSVFGYTQRGVETDNGLVVLSKDDMAKAAGVPRTGRAKDVPVTVAFHPREKVYGATVAGDSVQNVYPDKGGEKAYLLLREALVANPDVVACMIWAPTSKNALWTLEVVGDRIVATKRAWPESVRPTLSIPNADLVEAERTMFSTLVASTVEDFDLSVYSDQAKLGLAELVAQRASGASPLAAVVDTPQASPADLLAAITASLEAVGAKTNPPAKKAPAKRAPAKRTAAKKTATPARKRAPKKAMVAA